MLDPKFKVTPCTQRTSNFVSQIAHFTKKYLHNLTIVTKNHGERSESELWIRRPSVRQRVSRMLLNSTLLIGNSLNGCVRASPGCAWQARTCCTINSRYRVRACKRSFHAPILQWRRVAISLSTRLASDKAHLRVYTGDLSFSRLCAITVLYKLPLTSHEVCICHTTDRSIHAVVLWRSNQSRWSSKGAKSQQQALCFCSVHLQSVQQASAVAFMQYNNSQTRSQ